MRFLVTNDDGIDAPGIEALARLAETFGDVIVVAPPTELSGCSHRLTTDAPMTSQRRAAGRFVLGGTPGDCVRVGLSRLAGEVDAVLSGINAGGNLGADVYYSGTVAATREAALLGKPAFAFSQYRKRDRAIDWELAIRWIRPILADLLERPHAPGEFWNVNLPQPARKDVDPEVVFCPLDMHPIPTTYRDGDGAFHYAVDYHSRPRDPGSDVDVCFRDSIAVTRLVVGRATSAINPTASLGDL